MRKWLTKRVINSFARRFKKLDNAILTGKLSIDHGESQWRKCQSECRSYILDTPDEFLPEYLRHPLSYDDKEMSRRVIAGRI